MSGAKKMELVILRGKFSKKVFGFQVVAGRYTVQFAFWKFGLYDSATSSWIGG